MLHIIVPEMELFDSRTSTFVQTKRESIQLEHSLVSLSKWESKWCKPFIGNDAKTDEQIIDYIRCMTITQNINPEMYQYLPEDIFNQIEEYINAKMTATWFSDKQNPPGSSREVITSEIIYYWMITYNIPFECQKWHLNRLLTLIRVCSIKNQPAKKPGKREMLNSRNALNAARRAQHNTKG